MLVSTPDEKKMLHLSFFITIFCKILVASVATGNEADNNCMVSLIIPKESLKATCNGGDNYHTGQKLRSVESQLSLIRRDMNNIQVRQTYTFARNAQTEDAADISQRFVKLETSVAALQANLTKDKDENDGKYVNDELFNRKKIARLIRSILRRELAGLKDQIKQDIHKEFRQQLKDDIRAELLTYTKEDSKLVNGINSEILLRNIATDASESDDRNYHAKYAQLEEHHERLVQDEYDTIKSALDNELPERQQSRIMAKQYSRIPEKQTPSILQVDDQHNGMNMNGAIELLQNEVKKHLDKQTKKVKQIVEHHLNRTESKLNNIESIDKKFEKKYQRLREDCQRNEKAEHKLEIIERKIETLANGMASLHENMLSNQDIRDQFKFDKLTLKNGMLSLLNEESNPLRMEIEYLKNQTQVTSKLIQATVNSQKQTQASVQIFNATFKLNNYYTDKRLDRMSEEIHQLNLTLNPEYEDLYTLEESLHMIDVDNTVEFVREIRYIWPSVLDNLTAIAQMHETDLHSIEESFKHVENKFEIVSNNQTEFYERINQVQRDVNIIQDQILFMEQVKRQDALDKNDWAQLNFNHTYGRSGCFGGKKFVKKTGYEVGLYVGAVLCSPTRYKIYLSDSLNETFLNIGDTVRDGEDHCEFVGAKQNSDIKLKKGTAQFERIIGKANTGLKV